MDPERCSTHVAVDCQCEAVRKGVIGIAIENSVFVDLEGACCICGRADIELAREVSEIVSHGRSPENGKPGGLSGPELTEGRACRLSGSVGSPMLAALCLSGAAAGFGLP